jgi:hypothetical protein
LNNNSLPKDSLLETIIPNGGNNARNVADE